MLIAVTELTQLPQRFRYRQPSEDDGAAKTGILLPMLLGQSTQPRIRLRVSLPAFVARESRLGTHTENPRALLSQSRCYHLPALAEQLLCLARTATTVLKAISPAKDRCSAPCIFVSAKRMSAICSAVGCGMHSVDIGGVLLKVFIRPILLLMLHSKYCI